MSGLRILASRVFALFRSRHLDRELDDELASHVELATEAYVRKGFSQDDARFAALRDFGGVARTKDHYRDVRALAALEAFWQDLRFGFRSLVRRPLLLATATLSIGIAAGLNVSVYRAISGLLFDMNVTGVPPDPRLVEIGGEISFPNYTDLRTTSGFTDIAAIQMAKPLWQTDAGAEQISAKVVSANFFDVVHVRPVLGRAFHDDEAQVVILSFQFWQRRFGSDPGVVGRTITLNGWPFVVSGVLPREFNAHAVLFMAHDVILPISPLIDTALTNRAAPQFDVVGRLSDGVTVAQATVALMAKGNDIARQFPQLNARFARSLSLSPIAGVERWRQLSGGRLGVVFTVAAVVYGVFFLVLLIACANVAGLLLARAEERRREMAISAALGASTWRLGQRALAEGAVVAMLGCAAGGVLFSAGATVITRLAWTLGGQNVIPPSLPLWYCGVLVLIITVACSLAPALSVSHVAPALASASSTSRRKIRGTSALVIVQVATCVVLLSGALFLVQGLMNLRTADPGFDIDHTLAVSVRVPTQPAESTIAPNPFGRIRETLERLPGVESVSCVRYLPLSILTWRAFAHLEHAEDSHLGLDIHPVGPRYLETMRIPLLRGRDLIDGDAQRTRGTGRPVVVNETLARRFFGATDAIGRRIIVEDAAGEGLDQTVEVVGIARDSKLRSLNEDSHPVLYLPELTTTFVVRVAGPAPAAVRGMVRAVGDREPGASAQVSPMSSQVALALLPTQVGSTVFGALSAIGLALAMAGLYAVVNYAANSRTFELGIRMALGATAGAMMRLMLRQALVILTIGCVIGSLFAVALGRLLSPLLVAGQSLIDVPVLGSTIIIVTVIGLAASAWPARRAGRVDPAIALRTE